MFAEPVELIFWLLYGLTKDLSLLSFLLILKEATDDGLMIVSGFGRSQENNMESLLISNDGVFLGSNSENCKIDS